MVFMGDWGAEQGKNAITEGLRHVSFIAMHRVHHEPEGRIDDTAGVLRIHILQQGHGAFDVGEEGRNGLALPIGGAAGLQRRLLGQDAFGQVAWRVRDGSHRRGIIKGGG